MQSNLADGTKSADVTQTGMAGEPSSRQPESQLLDPVVATQIVRETEQKGGVDQQQLLQSAQNLLEQSPGIITATDNNPFPPDMLSVKIKQNIPANIKTWAHLRQWSEQNPVFMPNIDANKLLLLQVLHFQNELMKQNAGSGSGSSQGPGGAGPLAPAPMNAQSD